MKKFIAGLLVLLALGGGEAQAQWMKWTGGGTATAVSSSAYPLLAPDGTAGAPSYSFSTSPNVGFFLPSANNIDVSLTGASQYRFATDFLNINNTKGIRWWSDAAAYTTILTTLVPSSGILEQRNGTNPQTFRVYNTFTDGSNYERGTFDWVTNANVLTIAAKAAGTGTQRAIVFDGASYAIQVAGATKWQINSSGHLVAAADNALDLGASGATRPRNVYAATGIVSPIVRSAQTSAPVCSTNCGTTPAVAGGDTGFTITLGTTPASGFLITFSGTWAAAPSCVAQMGTAGMVVGKQVLTIATTTTTATFVTNGTAPSSADKYHVHCIGVA